MAALERARWRGGESERVGERGREKVITCPNMHIHAGCSIGYILCGTNHDVLSQDHKMPVACRYYMVIKPYPIPTSRCASRLKELHKHQGGHKTNISFVGMGKPWILLHNGNHFVMIRCQLHANITELSNHAPHLAIGSARKLKKLHKQQRRH